MSISYNERIDNPCEEMAQLARKFLPLAKWEFNETYRSVKDGRLIYNSQLCRVKFVWAGWDEHVGNSINVFYGRLHALNDRQTMVWNQEDCYCWHGLTSREVLNFLDGLSPQETVSQKSFPQIITQIRKSDLWQSLVGERRQPELTIRMNATIWDHYGVRLFELFDLRRIDLWEKYRLFLKGVYDIKGRNPNIKPPLDSVC
jgi:hypothetical protein